MTLCLVALACAGCTSLPLVNSFDGKELAPGTSRAADVERVMGLPAEKIVLAGGDGVWFYPRNPAGRFTYAVRFSPEGVVRQVDQRLTEANVRRITPGTMTTRGAVELFGPPYEKTWLPMQAREVWYYLMYDELEKMYVLGVRFSRDGVVREVVYMPDPKENSGVP